ncbi:MAG: hypothetical protein ACK4PH_24455 [Aquincola tertiaricarbonis]
MAWLTDLVLGVLLLEAAVLWWLARPHRRGVPFADVAGSLLAGLCLVLAVREAASGSTGGGLASWLAAAGIAHAFDLHRRWRRRPAAPPSAATPDPSAVPPGPRAAPPGLL